MNFLRNLFSKKVRIVTHDGRFHADDVFAVAALQIYFEKQGQKIEVVRSRRPEIIATGDIVVDNGRTYDPAKKIFDHHQTGGAGARENGVPYAAFGLIWKHYGEEICGSREAVRIVDEKMVQSIDFVDADPRFANVQKMGLNHYMIDNLVISFFPSRTERRVGDDAHLPQFLEAVKLAKRVLQREIFNANLAVADMLEVEKIYENTEDKRIIVFDQDMSWVQVLCKKPEPLFVVHPKYNGEYGIRAMPVKPGSFDNRKQFPKEWGGRSGADFQQLTGVETAIFCHASLFLAGAKTKEDAIKLAQKAVAVDSTSSQNKKEV